MTVKEFPDQGPNHSSSRRKVPCARTIGAAVLLGSVAALAYQDTDQTLSRRQAPLEPDKNLTAADPSPDFIADDDSAVDPITGRSSAHDPFFDSAHDIVGDLAEPDEQDLPYDPAPLPNTFGRALAGLKLSDQADPEAPATDSAPPSALNRFFARRAAAQPQTEQSTPEKPSIAKQLHEAVARHEAESPAAPVSVTTFKTRLVQDGDTIESLAQEEGTTSEQIIADNPHIADPNLIRANRDVIRLATTTEETTDATFDAELEAAFSPNNIDASEEVYTAVGERIQAILDSSDVGTMDLQVSMSGDTMYVSFRMPSQNSERDDSSTVILNLGSGAGGTMTPEQMGALDNMILGVKDLGLSLTAGGVGAVMGAVVGVIAHWRAEQIGDYLDNPHDSTLPRSYHGLSSGQRRDARHSAPIPEVHEDQFLETLAAQANALSRDGALYTVVPVIRRGKLVGAFLSRPSPADGSARIQPGFYRLDAHGQVVQVTDQPQTSLRRSVLETPVTPEPPSPNDGPVPVTVLNISRFGRPTVVDTGAVEPGPQAPPDSTYHSEGGDPERRDLGAAAGYEFNRSPEMRLLYGQAALIFGMDPEELHRQVDEFAAQLGEIPDIDLSVIYQRVLKFTPMINLRKIYEVGGVKKQGVGTEYTHLRNRLTFLIFDEIVKGNPKISDAAIRELRRLGIKNPNHFFVQTKWERGLDAINTQAEEMAQNDLKVRIVGAGGAIWLDTQDDKYTVDAKYPGVNEVKVGRAFVFVASALVGESLDALSVPGEDSWVRVLRDFKARLDPEYTENVKQFIVDHIDEVITIGNLIGDEDLLKNQNPEAHDRAAQLAKLWLATLDNNYDRDSGLIYAPPYSINQEVKDGGAAVDATSYLSRRVNERLAGIDLHLEDPQNLPGINILRAVLISGIEIGTRRLNDEGVAQEINDFLARFVQHGQIPTPENIATFVAQFDPGQRLRDVEWGSQVDRAWLDSEMGTNSLERLAFETLDNVVLEAMTDKPDITAADIHQRLSSYGRSFLRLRMFGASNQLGRLEFTGAPDIEEQHRAIYAKLFNELRLNVNSADDLDLMNRVTSAVSSREDARLSLDEIAAAFAARQTSEPLTTPGSVAGDIATAALRAEVHYRGTVDTISLVDTYEAALSEAVRRFAPRQLQADLIRQIDDAFDFEDTVSIPFGEVDPNVILQNEERLERLDNILSVLHLENVPRFDYRTAAEHTLRDTVLDRVIRALDDNPENLSIRRELFAVFMNLEDVIRENPLTPSYLYPEIAETSLTSRIALEIEANGDLDDYFDQLRSYEIPDERIEALRQLASELAADAAAGTTTPIDAAALLITETARHLPLAEPTDPSNGDHRDTVDPQLARLVGRNPGFAPVVPAREKGNAVPGPQMQDALPTATESPIPLPPVEPVQKSKGASDATHDLVTGNPTAPEPAVEPGASVLAAEAPDDGLVQPGEFWDHRRETDLADLTPADARLLEQVHPSIAGKPRLTAAEARTALTAARETAAAEQAAQATAQEVTTIPTDTPTAAPIENNDPGVIPAGATWSAMADRYGITQEQAKILHSRLPLYAGRPVYSAEQVAAALDGSQTVTPSVESLPATETPTPNPDGTVSPRPGYGLLDAWRQANAISGITYEQFLAVNQATPGTTVYAGQQFKVWPDQAPAALPPAPPAPVELPPAPVTPPPVVETVVTPTPEQIAAQAAVVEQDAQRVAAEQAAKVTAANQLVLQQQAAEAEAARVEPARIEADRVAAEQAAALAAQTPAPPAIEATPVVSPPEQPATPPTPQLLTWADLAKVDSTFDQTTIDRVVDWGGVETIHLYNIEAFRTRAHVLLAEANAHDAAVAAEAAAASAAVTQPEVAATTPTSPPAPVGEPDPIDPPADVATNYTAEGDEVLEYLAEQERLDKNMQVTIDAARRDREYRAAQVRQFEGIRDVISAAGEVSLDQIDAIVRQGRELGGGVADLAEALAENRLARNFEQAAGVVVAIIVFLVATEGA